MVFDKPRLPGVSYAGEAFKRRKWVAEGGQTMRVTWG
jgi:hypothetical protein